MIDDLYETIALDRLYKLLPKSSALIQSLSLNDLLRKHEGLGRKANKNGSKKNGFSSILNMQNKNIKTLMTDNRKTTAFLSDQGGQSEKSDLRDPEVTLDLFTEPFRLSEVYSESRVVLLPVGPYLVHAYWEVSSSDMEKARSELGKDFSKAQPVLRFYDITFIIFDGTNAHNYFDIEVKIKDQSSYVNLYSPEKSYCIDLGFRARDGEFLPLARSNFAETPRAWPSAKKGPASERIAADLPRNNVHKKLNSGHSQNAAVSIDPADIEKNRLKDHYDNHESTKTRNFERVTEAEESTNNNDSGPEVDLSEMCENQWIPGTSSK